MKSDSRIHLCNRLIFFFAGMVLFVAPFAVVMTALKFLLQAFGLQAGSAVLHSEPTVHRAMCLRMPLDWALWEQGTFISRIVENPLYALIFVLILFSIFAGPLFCGWLCPGMVTEHLSRLVPSRMKINLKGTVDPAPVRYGFLAGFFVMASPLVNKSICCGYCNWTPIEDAWNALFGRMAGITGGNLFAFSSSSIITFLLTFGILGVFIEGGRGWCNFMCPAGALQNLAHWLGAKLRFTYKLRLEKEKCSDCLHCVEVCPAWAIIPSENSITVNRHVCNGCKDCIPACPNGALSYTRRQP